MSDQWFYRMFGEEFGPVSFEKLKELTDCGTLSGGDEVRSSVTSTWVMASSVDQLGLEAGTSTVAVATAGTDFDLQGRSGNDEWFCMIGGTEFGPWSFDELAKYAENEQLSADDEVKLGENGKWRRVGSIGRLMALLPYKSVEKKILPKPRKPVAPEPSIEEFELPPIKNEDQPVPPRRPRPSNPDVQATPVPAQATLASAPVAPVDAAVVAAQSAVNTQAAFQAAYEQAKAKIAESMIAQAESAYKAAEEQAKSQIAWASGANVDKFWWGWAGGVEFGPVEFNQVFGLAKSGQLKPTDFVRNGQFGQFAPSSSIPGLFTAISMIAKAAETLNLAKTQAQSAAALAAPPPVVPGDLMKAPVAVAAAPVAIAPAVAPATVPAPTPSPVPEPVGVQPSRPFARSNPDMSTMSNSQSDFDAPREEERRPEPMRAPSSEPRPTSYGSPYSSSMSGGFSSSMSTSTMSTYGTSRPVAAPPKSYFRPAPKRDSQWLSDLTENLKEPKAMGIIGAIAVVALLACWQFLPKSRGADIAKYKQMKELLAEIKSKRTSAPSELSALQTKLSKMGKDITLELKDKASRDDPAKQCLLWAARDEIPRMVTQGLTAEGTAEKCFEGRLQEAAYELRLEKRPPVDPALQLARTQED